MTTRWDITRAVRSSQLPSPARLVMLVLADVAEIGTAEIPPQRTPSVTVLTQETGLGKSTVKSHLARLEEAGWVVRTRPTLAEQLRGARVQYALRIGAVSYEAGSGADPALGQEKAHPGSGDNPGWASSGPRGGSGADPLIGTDVSDGVDTPLPPAAPERPATAEPRDEEGTTQEDPQEPTPPATPPASPIDALIAEIRGVRPEWTADAIRRVLAESRVQERPPAVVAAALRLVAADPRSTSPGRLRADGPWWAEAAAAVRRRTQAAAGHPGGAVVRKIAERAAQVAAASDAETAAAQRAAARAEAVAAAGRARTRRTA